MPLRSAVSWDKPKVTGFGLLAEIDSQSEPVSVAQDVVSTNRRFEWW